MGINAADAAYEARRQQQLDSVLTQMESERQAKIAEQEKAKAPVTPEQEDLWTDRPDREAVLQRQAQSTGVYSALNAIRNGAGDPNVTSADVNAAFLQDLKDAGSAVPRSLPALGATLKKQWSDFQAWALENPNGIQSLNIPLPGDSSIKLGLGSTVAGRIVPRLIVVSMTPCSRAFSAFGIFCWISSAAA